MKIRMTSLAQVMNKDPYEPGLCYDHQNSPSYLEGVMDEDPYDTRILLVISKESWMKIRMTSFAQVMDKDPYEPGLRYDHQNSPS